MLDEAGREVHVFDANGMRIPRREAIIEDTTVNGMLFNLRRIQELFMRDTFDDDVDVVDDTPMTPHYVYPMAGLKTIGHFQAQGLMAPFIRKLKQLNSRLRHHFHDEDEDMIEADLTTGYSPLIEGVACQGYNMLSHRVRTAGRYHEVQLGLMTAALAGTHHPIGSNANTARHFYNQCEDWLPFERYHEKISGTLVDTSTRIENVYRISLRRIPAQHRNGR